MRILLLTAAAALVLAPAALAKGPASGTLAGPGLAEPLVLDGGGHPGSAGTLGRAAEHGGLYAAVYGARLDPTKTFNPRPPAGALGPRYVLVFRIHQSKDRLGTFRQVVYPYARGGAVTYTRRGQRPLGSTERPSRGGWWRGGARLKAVLVEAGLPTAPSH